LISGINVIQDIPSFLKMFNSITIFKKNSHLKGNL
jgi:hypothetical protein